MLNITGFRKNYSPALGGGFHLVQYMLWKY